MSKRTRILLKRILIRLGVVTIVICSFYVYFKTGFLTIHNYEIVGVDEKYIPGIQANLHSYDKKKLYKILPANRVITYHNKDIKNYIKELLPNTSSVSVYPISLHTLKINVSSYAPLFKLDNKKAITNTATIYTEINDISHLPELSFATSTSITTDSLSRIADIVPKISATVFDVKFIYIDEFNDIYIGGDNKSSIILPENGDIKKIWSNLVSAIDTEPLKSKLNTSKNNLLYLDTRFGNKVFYKFTNGVKTDIIPNTNHASTTSSTTLSH